MHHSYTHSQLFDLDHSYTDPSRGVGGHRGTSTRLYGGTLTRTYGAATLMKDLEKVIGSRFFLIT